MLHVSLPIASQMGAVQKFNELLGKLGPAELSTFMIGGGLASTVLAVSIYCYIDFYDKKLYEKLSGVKADLRSAETEYNVQAGKFNKNLKKVKEALE